MIFIFVLFLILGIIFLLSGINKIKLEYLNKRFLMQDLNLYKQKKNTKDKVKTDVQLSGFFVNIYSKNKGLNKKYLFILILVMFLSLIANNFFLSLNAFIVLILSFFLGIFLVNFLKAKEVKDDFEKNFPELLVVLNGAISSGGNVTQALNDCSNAISGVLRDELKIIVKSLSIGEEPYKVFAASYKRLPFKSYYSFLTSLLISISSGARLKEVLSRLAIASTRAKAIEKKKNAMTSEARMSSKITAGIPFVFLFLMKFISPENFDFILHDERGRYILYYFLGSQFIGMLIIMFLMRRI